MWDVVRAKVWKKYWSSRKCAQGSDQHLDHDMMKYKKGNRKH